MSQKKFEFSLLGNIKIKFTLTEDLIPTEQLELIRATNAAFKWIDDTDDEPTIQDIRNEIHIPELQKKVSSCRYLISTVYFKK